MFPRDSDSDSDSEIGTGTGTGTGGHDGWETRFSIARTTWTNVADNGSESMPVGYLRGELHHNNHAGLIKRGGWLHFSAGAEGISLALQLG